MKTEFLGACDQAVGAAFNGIWQGIVVTALVALCLRALGRTNAATRHGVWFCALVLVVFMVPAQALRKHVSGARPSSSAARSAKAEVSNYPGALARLDLAAPGDGRTPLNWYSLTPAEAALPELGERAITAPTEVAGDSPGIPWNPDLQSITSGNLGPTPVARAYPTAPPLAPPSETLQGNLSKIPEISTKFPIKAEISVMGEAPTTAPPKDERSDWSSMTITAKAPRFTSMFLLGCWLAIAGGRIAALLLRLRKIREIKRAASLPGTEMSALFHQLRADLEVKRSVELRFSLMRRSPVVLGFLHPVVLLPEQLNGPEAEAVLRHELAHVRRYDDWANLIQHFLAAVFFFHPAILWIARQMSLEREIACDDHVLEYGGRPRAYALLLTQLAGRLQAGPLLLAPGASTNKSQLQQRIDMILDTKRNRSPRLAGTRLGYITTAAALMGFAGIYLAPRIVLAQSEPSPTPASDQPSSASAPTALPDDEVPQAAPTPEAVGPGPKHKPGSPPVPRDVPTPEFAPSPVPRAPFAPRAATLPPGPVAPVEPTSLFAPVPAVRAPLAPQVLTVPTAPVAPVLSPSTGLTPAPAPYALFTPQLATLPPAPVAARVGQPAIPAVPANPSGPTYAPVALAGPSFASADMPEPRPPRPARAAANPSLEDRVAHLEQMVQDLMAMQKAKPGHLPGYPQSSNWTLDRKDTMTLDEMAREQAQMAREMAKEQQELARAQQEMARHQAEMAREKAEIARQHAEAYPRDADKIKRQAERDAARSADQAKRFADDPSRNWEDRKEKSDARSKEDVGRQIQSLRKQSEALQRNLERVNREIERLQRSPEKDGKDDEKEDKGAKNSNSNGNSHQTISIQQDCVTSVNLPITPAVETSSELSIQPDCVILVPPTKK